MKTKTILLICLLSGMGLTWLSGQTRSYPVRFPDISGWETPVYCDGVEGEVDRVVFDDVTIKGTFHYVDGNPDPVWGRGKLSGVAHSKNTNEVFTYMEIDPRALFTEDSYTVIYNLKGDQGNHYTGTLIVERTDADLILHPGVLRAICVINGPKK